MAEIEFLEGDGIDHASAVPHGQPCGACGCPLEPQDKFCPACGTTYAGAAIGGAAIGGAAEIVDATVVPDDAVVDAEVVMDAPASADESQDSATPAQPTQQKFLRCDNCGAEIGAEGTQRSITCPFCDSTYVSEFSPSSTGRQEPEFVIGFAVTPDQAHAKFKTWISEKSVFRPGDLKSASIEDKLKGVYLPFWSFSMLAESRWNANIGEYWYRTETYTTRDSKGNTVTKTRRVRETEWWPLAGRHHRYYHGYLVSGSKGLPQDQAERIKPFNLPALKRYEPMYLAGWIAEEYSVLRDDAEQRCAREFQRREEHNIGAFLPGDTHSSLQVSTHFSGVNSDLCLLPMYILSYRYGDKLYRFLVNGQTGRCAGDKPKSWKRIGLFTLAVVAAIAAVVILIVVVSNG